jgi:hypothetical protein
VPLLSIIEDKQARKDLKELARQYNQEMVSERAMDTEAQVLEIIRDILDSPYGALLSVKDIASRFFDRHGNEYKATITPKWMGSVIRKKLKLKTVRTREGYVIPPSETYKLERLYEKYGIELAGETENKLDPARDMRYRPAL